MSQKNVELLLGKILTDDEFRNAFLPVGPASFALASRFGLEFTAVERAALSTLQPRAFESLARTSTPASGGPASSRIVRGVRPEYQASGAIAASCRQPTQRFQA